MENEVHVFVICRPDWHWCTARICGIIPQTQTRRSLCTVIAVVLSARYTAVFLPRFIKAVWDSVVFGEYICQSSAQLRSLTLSPPSFSPQNIPPKTISDTDHLGKLGYFCPHLTVFWWMSGAICGIRQLVSVHLSCLLFLGEVFQCFSFSWPWDFDISSVKGWRLRAPHKFDGRTSLVETGRTNRLIIYRVYLV